MVKSLPEEELLRVKSANRALQKQLARMRADREKWISGIELALAEAVYYTDSRMATPKNVALTIRALVRKIRYLDTRSTLEDGDAKSLRDGIAASQKRLERLLRDAQKTCTTSSLRRT